MDQPRRERALETDASRPDRAASGPLRLLVALIMCCSLVAGTVVFAPGIVDMIADELANVGSAPSPDTPPASETEPAPAGDRAPPEQIDPDDPGETTYNGSAPISSTVVEGAVHEAVNDRRREAGLDPLDWDDTVASVSRAHSADMADREYFGHQNPDGEDPWDRFTDEARYCRRYGENIAMTWVGRPVRSDDGTANQYTTAEDLAAGLVEQWMNSPPHREAIQTESWDRGGVGVTITADGQVFATHNFCDAGGVLSL